MNWLASLLAPLRRPARHPNAWRQFQPSVEQLEARVVPIIASQLPLTTLAPLTLTSSQVAQLLNRAAAATPGQNAIVAVVDRSGDILGVRVEANVSTAVTGNASILDFSIDGAVSLARTAAFFSSDADPLTSRTVQFISQSTITQREVESYTFISNPNSTIGGPGFVAPIGIGGHFPPGVDNTPQVDLFGIENTNRQMLVNPAANGILNTPGSASLSTPFSSPAANDAQGVNVGLNGAFNAGAGASNGLNLIDTLSYFDSLYSAANQSNPNVPHVASRGIATLPGGIPLYENGVLVGGIGVFFPGSTGFADAENSQLSANYNPKLPDLSELAEAIAFAAAGGSTGANFPIGTIAGIPALPGFNLPNPQIQLAGITLDTVGPGGQQGPVNLIHYIKAEFGITIGTDSNRTLLLNGKPIPTGAGNEGVNEPVNAALKTLLPGQTPPTGWLVAPHAGVGITAAQVTQIIDQGIATAQQTRSQLRPLGVTTEMVFAVTDQNGNIVGLYRMADAPIFSIDVAISKGRDTEYYDNAAQLNPVDQLPGIPAGAALTARTFRFLAIPHYPEGIDSAPPGVWSILNDPGTNPNTGMNTGAPKPISAFTSVFGFDAFHPNTTFHEPVADNAGGRNSSGIVFFPGSSAVYVNGKIVGGFGVSGDGVSEDDVVTAGGIAHFEPAAILQVDEYTFRGVRLPYQNFDRNPNG
jgi:uncharacterized protein GlcG (DUF336 family)